MGRENSFLVHAVHMRVIRLFFQFFFFFAVIGAFIYIAGTRIWLVYAVSVFGKDIESLTVQQADTNSLTTRCSRAPSASEFSKALALQVRFLDDKTYAIEIVCSFIESTPVVLETKTLPMWTTKEPGSSGLYIDLQRPAPSSIRLRVFNVTQDLRLADGKLTEIDLAAAPLSPGVPQAACMGYGYACCEGGLQAGKGDSRSVGVTDCPENCYSSCAALPYVQSFTADPYPENQEVVLTESSQAVVFSFVADHTNGKVSKVEIDYGDGQQETSLMTTGIFTHTYVCPTECRHTAKLTVFDSQGNTSVENSTSVLYIHRKGL